MEWPVPVINAGTQEIRQHIVAVGRADQLPHRQAHALSVIRRQNIPEVAGGDAEIHLVPHGDGSVPHQIAVGRNIIDYLRQNSSPVNRVRGGQKIPPFVQLRPQGLIRKNALDTGLCIVKVADDRADIHVFAPLRHHLGLLHRGNTVLGVIDLNPGLGHIRKSGHSGLAGIAGGSRQNAGCSLFTGLPQSGGQKLRQHLQGHILERGRRAVPQLQTIGILRHAPDRRRSGIVKLLRAVGALSEGQQLLLRIVGQIQRHDLCRPMGIIHRHQAFQKGPVDLRDSLGRQQSAIAAQPHLHSLRRRKGHTLVPRAEILHKIALLL